MGKITGFMEYQRLEEAAEAAASRKQHRRDRVVHLAAEHAKIRGSSPRRLCVPRTKRLELRVLEHEQGVKTPAACQPDSSVWRLQRAVLTRTGLPLDANLADDEIENMNRSDERKAVSRSREPLCHMMKWHLSPELHGCGWVLPTPTLDQAVAESIKASGPVVAIGNNVAAHVEARATGAVEMDPIADAFPETCPLPHRQRADASDGRLDRRRRWAGSIGMRHAGLILRTWRPLSSKRSVIRCFL